MALIKLSVMGLWDSRELAELARKDFDRAWRESVGLAQGSGKPELGGMGRAHPLFDTVQRLRQAYIELGFEEVVNPILIEEKEVRRQFDGEAMAVLDRCFYLAGLPRPNVGISAERAERLREAGVRDVEKLRQVLHAYKKGRFTGDELLYRVAEAASIDADGALRLLQEHFPELQELKPVAGSLTLRSHMTSGWFLTLRELYGKRRLPLKLFSVDRCFRREQREDATHLRSYHSASCVVMGDVGLEAGREVAAKLLERLGFTELKFREDEKQSKYYAPGTQTEVYARHGRGWVEVATFGMYSPAVLSLYGIEVPVMNLGMGVERIAMLLHGREDVRELVYPQFYSEWRLSDEEIADMLRLVEVPESGEGRKVAQAIARTVREHAHATAPCRFLAYEGRLMGRHARVWVAEQEEGKRLAGPAALNVIAVHDGNVLAFPPEEAKGVEKVSCAMAVSMRFAARLERAAASGSGSFRDRVGMAKSLADINLELDEVARNYITSKEKRIKVGGPVFLSVEAELV